MDKKFKLYQGDNMVSLKKLPDNSIDSIVSDPPYGLSFMGKKWDYDVPSVEFWKEVYRVLKPGGHILSFGGTRTYHRMVVNIEDVGFEIRDQIQWIYGSGFPKSLNISKSIDKIYGRLGYDLVEIKSKLKELYKSSGKNMNKIDEECGFKASGYLRTEIRDDDGWGQALPTIERWNKIKEIINYNNDDLDGIFLEAEREIVGSKNSGLFNGGVGNSVGGTIVSKIDLTKSKTPKGEEWEGWGTALKPANEPICLARKPLSEKSVAENVIKWKTGGINVDGCRVGYTEGSHPRDMYGESYMKSGHGSASNELQKMSGSERNGVYVNDEGRFPANIIFECICDEVINENTHTNPDCPCYILDQQSGVSKSSKSLMGSAKSGNSDGRYNWNNGDKNDFESIRGHNDKGGSSRFFYNAKVSKAERNMGLDEFEEKNSMKWNGTDGHKGVGDYYPDGSERPKTSYKNNHPTVKPVSLMTYLCRLITPENGIILDPFMGSGSTGIASQLEGFRFVGMEMDEEYFKIATKRIEEWEKYKKFVK